MNPPLRGRVGGRRRKQLVKQVRQRKQARAGRRQQPAPQRQRRPGGQPAPDNERAAKQGEPLPELAPLHRVELLHPLHRGHEQGAKSPQHRGDGHHHHADPHGERWRRRRPGPQVLLERAGARVGDLGLSPRANRSSGHTQVVDEVGEGLDQVVGHVLEFIGWKARARGGDALRHRSIVPRCCIALRGEQPVQVGDDRAQLLAVLLRVGHPPAQVQAQAPHPRRSLGLPAPGDLVQHRSIIPRLAVLLALLVQVLCMAPLRAQERTLPPPLNRGGLCPGLLPCAESGPLAAHLRGTIRLTPPDASSAPGAGMGADATFGLSFGLFHQAELGASIGTSGVVSAWGRLTPGFLSDIGPGGAFSLGAWFLSETVPPQMDHGLYYLDAQTYGAAADIQKWIITSTLYAAYQGGAGGAYHGGQAGAGLWFTLSAQDGVQAGGELLARFGQRDGQPGQAQLVGFLGVRMFNEWGAAVSFSHARTLAGTDGPWSASAVVGNSIGPSYLVPARSQSSLLEDLLAAIRQPHLPTLHLPELGSLTPAAPASPTTARPASPPTAFLQGSPSRSAAP